MSEEYSVGYEEGYQAGWNAAIDAYTTPQPVSQEPVAGYDITQREDGEGFVVPTDEVYGLVCCDCGLVHDVVWSYDKDTNELGMAAKRNDEATKQRRAEQTEQEPVAWHEPNAYGNVTVYEKWAKENGWQPLYTAPPKREWVDLTDDEVWKIYGITGLGNGMALRFARAIEAKLKEKNT